MGGGDKAYGRARGGRDNINSVKGKEGCGGKGDIVGNYGIQGVGEVRGYH